MEPRATASEKERREWSCPSCGALIDTGERFHFLFEYQKYMEASERPGESARAERPRFACRSCLASQELIAEERRGGSPVWALWLAVALIPTLFGLLIISIVAAWLT